HALYRTALPAARGPRSAPPRPTSALAPPPRRPDPPRPRSCPAGAVPPNPRPDRRRDPPRAQRVLQSSILPFVSTSTDPVLARQQRRIQPGNAGADDHVVVGGGH